MHPAELNDVTIEKIKLEIGDQGWSSIKDLTHFLFVEDLTLRKYPGLIDKFALLFTTGEWYGVSKTPWGKQIPDRGRFAPSVVSRIEVGVFGTSMPRFCYRLYFANSEGFINVRRLKTLQASLKDIPELWSAQREESLKANERHPRIIRQLNADVFFMHDDRGHFAIADCLLRAPTRYPDSHFHVLRAKVLADHGESLDTEAMGTPFVKTVDFGGGLCAQACALVCTTLLRESASAIHGLSEVTALASSPDLKELLIAGLTIAELVTYFRNVELGAIPQFVNPNMREIKTKRRLDTEYSQALHGYVSSGMPLILFVDISSLNGNGVSGESVYDSNGISLDVGLKEVCHAVTVVGCSQLGDARSGKTQCGEFLLMDSATFPFVIAKSDQLSEIGSWEIVGDSYTGLRHPIAISVTPKEVKLPLLCFYKHGPTTGWRRGLIELCNRCTKSPVDPCSRQFILTNFAELPFIRISRFFPADFDNLSDSLLCRTLPEEAKKRFGWDSHHWMWLECGPGVVRVWDAEVEPSDDYKIEEILRAIIQICECKLGLLFFEPVEEMVYARQDDSILPAAKCCPEEDAKHLHFQSLAVESRYALRTSLITSFTAHGLRLSAERWKSVAPEIQFVEAYICMQADLGDFFGKRDEGRAVKVLAEMCNVDGADKMFADSLRTTFSGKQIIAFASFIPEIMALNPAIFEEAQKALRFLVKTARHLRDPMLGPFTIEIVGGTRLQGIWKAETKDGAPALAANRLDAMTACQTLLDRLIPVADEAAKEEGVQIAIESEPGPIFVCDPFGGTTSTLPSMLRTLCSQIKASAKLRHVVGVNLDIAHWAFLSKLSIDWLRLPEGQVIRDRIVHAHISDHGNGHFSDNAIGTCNKLEKFRPWMEFLEEISLDKRDKGIPRFSGFISCEMEACKSSDFIRYALKNMNKLMCKNL